MKNCSLLFAVFLSTFVGASPAEAKNLYAKWDPPQLSNPIVLDLNNRPSWFKNYEVPNGRDVVIIGKSTGTWPGFTVNTPGNSNHCIFIGGKYTSKVRATGFLKTIYMEGLHIDNMGVVNDAIVACGATNAGGGTSGWGKPTVYLQNILVQGVKGSSTLHGDVYQPQGRVGALRIYNMTGWTGHQGLQIDNNSMLSRTVTRSGIGLWIERVNLRHINHNRNATALYQWDRNKGYTTYLKNFWITQKSGTRFQDQSFFPAVRDGAGEWLPNDNAARLWYTSTLHRGDRLIHKGVPSGGDFVTSGQVGAGYTSSKINY